jgi:hypothetical protein
MNSHQSPPKVDHVPQVLAQRPEATTFKVEDLLAEVKRGRIRIPPFQRPFKWKRDDALKLLESIYLGYPVGTLLLWQTKAEAGETRFGSVVVPGPARPDAYWVVDGQQRLMSLVRTLLAASPGADEFSLFFDLEKRRIVPSTAAGPSPLRNLPLTDVLDSERLMKWVFEHIREDQESVHLAFDLGKRIREYPIPAYVVRSDSDATLREIFGRVNRLGRRMTEDEVFEALNGVRSGVQPSSIEQIVVELRALHFGAVEKKVLYRLMRVLHGADIVGSAADLPPRLTDDEAAALYARAAAAAKRTVEFMMRDVGIPHYELLPYKQPLVTLGKFFDLHPSPSSRSRQLLARWVWRGALSAAHRGDTVSTRHVLDQIDGAEDDSVQRLLSGSHVRPAKLPDASSPFNFRHAESKLELLALLDLRPSDLSSKRSVETADLVEAESGRMRELPRVFTAGSHGASGPHTSVANRLAHPPRSGLRRAIVDQAQLQRVGVASADVHEFFGSHGIDGAAVAALFHANASEFLAARQHQLRKHFESFFSRRAQWEESDRPPLAALLTETDVGLGIE